MLWPTFQPCVCWSSIHCSSSDFDSSGCKELLKSTSRWAPIQKPLLLDSTPPPSIYYSCYFLTYYPRWDCIFLDHPACSIETFHKTVQWAAKPFCIQQNTVSSARRMFPCCVPAEGTVTRGILLMIFTFAPKFPLWRGGTTCTLPDKSFLQGKEENSMALSLVYISPSICMDAYMHGLPSVSRGLLGILIDHYES